MSSVTTRLVLGTAQLGLSYGIMNRTGKPSQSSSNRILLKAHAAGIRFLDTAQSYGNSEARIGEFHSSHDKSFSIITKLPKEVDLTSGAQVKLALLQAEKRLNTKIDVALIHDSTILKKWTSAHSGSLETVAREANTAFGISIYTPEEFILAMDVPVLSVIEAPFNLLDRRLTDMGLLSMAEQRQKRVILRSLFLQGLLLANVEAVPPIPAGGANAVRELAGICKQFSLSRLDLATGYVSHRCPGHEYVFGVETEQQLDEIVLSFAKGPLTDARIIAAVEEVKPGSLELIDPRTWKTA